MLPETIARMAEIPSVVAVNPNPHKEGTQTHASYRHWTVGATVEACVKAGLATRSVRRDVRHGHVVLGPPK